MNQADQRSVIHFISECLNCSNHMHGGRCVAILRWASGTESPWYTNGRCLVGICTARGDFAGRLLVLVLVLFIYLFFCSVLCGTRFWTPGVRGPALD